MFPDGNALVTGSEDSTCRIFDLRSDCEVAIFEKPSRRGSRSTNNTYSPTSPFHPITPITPNGPLGSASGNDHLTGGNGGGGGGYQPIDPLSSVSDIKFTPSGRLLFASYEDGIWGAWDILKGRFYGPLPVLSGKGGGGGGGDSVLSSVGGGVLSGSSSSNNGNGNHSGQVTGIEIDRNGSRIYTSNWDSLVSIFFYNNKQYQIKNE